MGCGLRRLVLLSVVVVLLKCSSRCACFILVCVVWVS